ncbi:condensation domain-containing protein [Micromonospora sp. NBC_01813]|uniref:condensation domain-containing protein n=1 Tax=Micromonospora sp. NBC_01813 TaxID=2975988 RepID=UPI002DDADCF5|nr:condensation domain-containing protein [Micromonospora sp. NBC_01813]WSA09117.1 condensation domain-containing protein [Micromonospora sp. NBC_01813]
MITTSSTDVEFHCGRTRRAPLTWGQEVIWDLMREQDDARTYAVLTRWMPIPLLLSVGDVLASIGELLRRHEALRTMYHPTAKGDATQEVLGSGALTVEMVDRPADDPTDYTSIITDYLVRASEAGFDHEKELPIRISVILQDGIPILLAFAVSHLSADFVSADLLVADLTAMLQARADGRPPPPARPATQPADLAALEGSPAGQLRNIEAIRFIRGQLDRAHPDMLPARAAPATPRFFRGQLESDAIAVAGGPAARRYRTSPSVLLLSITSALMRCIAPGPVYPIDLMQSNRPTPELAGTVCSLSQSILTVIDVSAGSFADLVRHCSAVVAQARVHGPHRKRAAQDIVDAAGAARGCQFNDIWSQLPGRPRPAATLSELQEMTASSTFYWPEKVADKNKDLFMGIRGTADRVHLTLFADTALLPPGDIRAFLDTFERTAVTLAFADVALDQIAHWFAEGCARYAEFNSGSG